MALDKLQALADFASRVDKKVLKEEDFLKMAEALVKHIKKIEVQMQSDAKTLADVVKRLDTKLTIDSNARLSGVKEQAKVALGKSFKEQANTLNFIKDRVRKIEKDLDARDERVMNDTMAQFPVQEVFEHPSPEAHRDEIESLGIQISAVDGLEERLEGLKVDKRLGRGGGGTSAIGVTNALGNIVKTETPSGLINGSNVTYTVGSLIYAVFSFGINGQTIHSDEYTISGRTITFTTALPSALSGTSFEIKYA